MIKRVVLFAGAVLVLAACDSATAPSISRFDGGAAAAKAKPKAGTIPNRMNALSEGCGGGVPGFFKRDGEGTDSVWVPCVIE